MNDPADILNFSFDAEFEPTRAPMLPEGKIQAILENFEQTEIKGEGKWAITPCKYAVTDAAYLQAAGRDSLTLTYDLLVELDESGKPKAPTSPEDETNNNLRRFFKAHGKSTRDPLSACVGQPVTLVMIHQVMKDRQKEVMLDEDGQPRKRAKIVRVGSPSAA